MRARKSSILFFVFLIIFCNNSFAKTLILERTVKNEVAGYNKRVYKENGKVTLYVNEFTNDKDGSKLGFAYAIESDSPETPVLAELNGVDKDFNSEQIGRASCRERV